MQDDERGKPARERTHPLRWDWAKASPPLLSSEQGPWRGTLLRCWTGTTPVMVQPPLAQNYLVMHLGGAKRVRRRGDGPEVATIVENESITLVPAGCANIWQTEGPIAFAHLYVPPDHMASVIERDFDGDGRNAELIARVGCRDVSMESLVKAMIHEIGQGPEADVLRLDCLYETACLRLAARHSTCRPGSNGRALGLAPHRMRRVEAFVEANLGRDIRLADLAAAADSSQSHFSHAFTIALGLSPYQYVLRQRIEWAKVLLLTSDALLDEIAVQCGFHSRHQFSLMFKRIVGMSPRLFRHPARTGRVWPP